MMPAQARDVSRLLWLWCLQSGSMSTLAGMLHATQDLELISPLHCTDGQHQSHVSAVKSQSLQHSARLRAHMTGPGPHLAVCTSCRHGQQSLQCHDSAACDTHPPPNCIMQVLSSRGSWPSYQESQQHPSQLAASLSADVLTAALGDRADAEQQRQLAQLLGELRRLEVHQDTLKKAVMENRPIVVHPRMKPQEEEEEEEEAKPSGPAKPKYIASGGWSCMCLKPEPGLHGIHEESCRSGPAKQVPNRSKRMGCQAWLGLCCRMLPRACQPCPATGCTAPGG